MTVRGRSPNLRFEFPATWPPAILVVGSLCTPRDRAGGKGPLSRRDAVAKLRLCKTKGVRTFGSTAAEIVCRGATLNTLSSFGFNCVYYALRVEG